MGSNTDQAQLAAPAAHMDDSTLVEITLQNLQGSRQFGVFEPESEGIEVSFGTRKEIVDEVESMVDTHACETGVVGTATVSSDGAVEEISLNDAYLSARVEE